MIRYKINGKRVTKKQWDARKGVGLKGGVPMGTIAYTESDPLISEGLGCMKSQVGELRAEIKKRGIQGVRVRNNGQLEITSRRGRAEVCKMRGLVDGDGGFGDG